MSWLFDAITTHRILHAADKQCRDSFAETIRARRPAAGHQDSETPLAGMVEAISAWFEGLKIRAIGNPNIDRDVVVRIVRHMVSDRLTHGRQTASQGKTTMTPQHRKWVIRMAVVLGVGALALFAWQRYGPRESETGLVSGNGRIEAVEIDVASRTAGRVKEIRVREGEFVTIGQVVALMDTDVLDAERRQAEAQLQQAISAVATADSQIAQRHSDRAAAQAVVAQRQVELKAATAHLARSMALADKGFLSSQTVDDERARVESAQAAVAAARAQVAAMESAIASARSQVAGAQSSAAAAQASTERIQADIDDTALKSPRDGRVQYIVARPGEVVGAGGRILNLVDLSDVYMTFFLPTAAAGKIALGTEVRLVLDAAPEFVIPAKVSFIADVAQFTPKAVETSTEREKLMFRVRAQLPPDLLRKHIKQVKTGLPGTAYVLLDADAEWPARLQVKLPDEPARSSR